MLSSIYRRANLQIVFSLSDALQLRVSFKTNLFKKQTPKDKEINLYPQIKYDSDRI